MIHSDKAFNQITGTARKRNFSVGDQIEVSGFYKPHDKYQVELKFEYNLDEEIDPNQFLVETYLFVPQSLGLSDYLNRATDYFPDITSYMRYSVQSLSLIELADLEYELSPLSRLLKFLQTGETTGKSSDRKSFFLYESKLFTCMFKESIKKEFSNVDVLIAFCQKGEKEIGSLCDFFTSLYKGIQLLKGNFEQINALLKVSDRVSEDDKAGFDAISEFFFFELNLFYITFTRKLIKISDIKHADLASLKIDVREDYKILRRLGIDAGYLVIDGDSSQDDREQYIYRESKLKKFVSSVLFLNQDVKSNKKAEEFFFSIAAGVAMLFAAVVALLTAQSYDINSFPWVISLVIAYIIKDRSKAWMQDKFRNLVPTYLSNRTEKLIDEGVGKVGRINEWLSFRSDNFIPKDILDVRLKNREMVGAFKKSEDVLYYKKLISLEPKIIFANHQRVNNVVNILRFNVQKFCQQMDDPKKKLNYLNDDGSVDSYTGKKVYHINLVIKITSKYGTDGKETETLNLRLVLSRDGIERIESPNQTPSEELFEVIWI
ncbi:MAG: hypothetical protein COA79_23610 [Planctomycetota bacterium]|nr:MAG: hypothetical protein COA79_23610 [Planctomycetota bacterium]